MQPPVWSPPAELSPAERAIVKRINRAKLFTLGHALHGSPASRGAGWLADTAVVAGIGLPVDRSLKAALDLDWDDPHASQVALTTVVNALSQLDTYLEGHLNLVAEAPLDLAQQEVGLTELHRDRAYLSSRWVRERDDGLEIYCKAWPVRQGPHFHKTVFTLDWESQIIRYPDGAELPFTAGAVVVFPEERCAVCPLRAPTLSHQA